MILRPRALVAEPSAWLAALIFCGLCALAWFGYRATDQWQRSAALLADHRGREAAEVLTRALTRDMYGVQTSSEQPRTVTASVVSVRANDASRGLCADPFRNFLELATVSGGTPMFARRSPAGLDHHAGASRRVIRSGPADPPEIARCAAIELT